MEHYTQTTPIGAQPRGILGLAQETPDPEPLKEYHPVHISKAENGFIVKVGCKTFVTLTWTETQSKLSDYWENPTAAQRKYCTQE